MGEMTYSQFVGSIVKVVSPLLSPAVSRDLSFSGSPEDGRLPGADSAMLSGKRAYTFLATAAIAHEFTGISPNDYGLAYGVATSCPLVYHAAYARNIRRWRKGTLPRKRKARADLVLVATCWLCGWEDGGVPSALARADASRLLHELAGAAPNGRREVAQLLWGLSADAYRTSIERRRQA